MEYISISSADMLGSSGDLWNIAVLLYNAACHVLPVQPERLRVCGHHVDRHYGMKGQ